MNESDLWTLAEVARYLRVSKNTVYGWANQGTIPASKVGRQWRFSKREITRWVHDRRRDKLTTVESQERSHAATLTA